MTDKRASKIIECSKSMADDLARLEKQATALHTAGRALSYYIITLSEGGTASKVEEKYLRAAIKLFTRPRDI